MGQRKSFKIKIRKFFKLVRRPYQEQQVECMKEGEGEISADLEAELKEVEISTDLEEEESEISTDLEVEWMKGDEISADLEVKLKEVEISADLEEKLILRGASIVHRYEEEFYCYAPDMLRTAFFPEYRIPPVNPYEFEHKFPKYKISPVNYDDYDMSIIADSFAKSHNICPKKAFSLLMRGASEYHLHRHKLPGFGGHKPDYTRRLPPPAISAPQPSLPANDMSLPPPAISAPQPSLTAKDISLPLPAISAPQPSLPARDMTLFELLAARDMRASKDMSRQLFASRSVKDMSRPLYDQPYHPIWNPELKGLYLPVWIPGQQEEPLWFAVREQYPGKISPYGFQGKKSENNMPVNPAVREQ